jgi:hypothetical protein
VRLPRTYRGRDVLWWMDASGVWDQRYDEVEDLTRARRLPSPQLVGTPERTTLDLNALTSMGVELVGRWAAVRDGRALFSGGLRNVFSLADLKMRRLLDTFDEWAGTLGRDGEADPPERFAPTRVPASARLQLDLRSGEIRAIVWATGFRPDYRWLDVPVLDAKSQLRHEGGVAGCPGLYALGLPVLRRRKSTFIYGIEDDAREVIGHLARHLAGLGLALGGFVAEFGPDPGHDLGGGRSWREDPGRAHPVELLDVRVGDDAAAEHDDVRGAAFGQQVDDAAEQRHVRPGENGQADRVDIFLDGGGHDLLRGLMQPGVDDLHPGVAQRPGHDLGSPVVAVEPDLRDDHPDVPHAVQPSSRRGCRSWR